MMPAEEAWRLEVRVPPLHGVRPAEWVESSASWSDGVSQEGLLDQLLRKYHLEPAHFLLPTLLGLPARTVVLLCEFL